MFSFFNDGGVFMYIIFGVSIVALALFFERATYLFLKLKIDADMVMRKVLVSLEKDNYAAALKECEQIKSHPLGRIFKAGLLKSDRKDKEIERAMEEKILCEI
ncbi:MAG: MotA/TolQ/ExbB proton channel family protein, partial [Nitrospinota bacterium]